MPPRRSKRRRKRYGSFCHEKGYHHSPKLGKKVKFRSSWERLFFEHLDADESVLSYEVESLRLPYVYGRSKKVKWYVPDVLVHYKKRTELVEIKPERFSDSPKVRAKTAAAKTFCQEKGFRFVMLTEVGLKELGVL